MGGTRRGVAEMSKTQRVLAYSLLLLIKSKELGDNTQSRTESIAGPSGSEDDVQDGTAMKGKVEVVNERSAWCWKANCDGALCSHNLAYLH